MSNGVFHVHPVAVALRGEEGSVASFSCELPASETRRVHVWATCGQRRRFPVPARIALDMVDEKRHVLMEVVLPPFYTACTLHVRIGSGLKALRTSCRIPHERFRALAPATQTPENNADYHDWFLAHRATEDDLRTQRSYEFPIQPLISIVTPIFKTPSVFLKEFIDSVLAQTYGRFELILVNVSGPCASVDETLSTYDDARIRVVTAPNRTIPENTNEGIAVARGDYIGFVDHDDFIEPDAFFRYVEMINAHPQCDLLFCDEDCWDSSDERFCGARFKPGWNRDLLYSHNYVCHLLMVSRFALEKTTRSDASVNGAQDYDFTLKASEVAREICHVPGILYHWRLHEASTASNRESKPYALEAGRLAVQGHFDRIGASAKVEVASSAFTYHPHYSWEAEGMVSIVLTGEHAPGARDFADAGALSGCKYEIIAVGADEDLNAAVRRANGDIVILINDSVRLTGNLWFSAVVEQIHAPAMGCCAPMLVNKKGLVESCGLVYGTDGVWMQAFKGYPSSDTGYMFMFDYAHDTLAVSPACMTFRKDAYDLVGGFDTALPYDVSAIDFCLRLREHGLLTAVVPAASLIVDEEFEDVNPHELGVDLEGGHPLLADGDPYFNPCLDQSSGSYTLS